MDLPLVAFFEKSGAGVTGLTVTVNVIAVPMTAPHTPTTVVADGTATETGLGFYQYFLSSYDLSANSYFASFTTTGDVDDTVRPSFEMDFALAQAASIAAIKADYARRTGDYATVANQTTIINAVNAIDAGSGTGAFAVAVTVNDGTDALENATVRLTEGANTFTATTDASGDASFSLDAATYAITITKDGYQFTPATIVVDATHTEFTESMTAVTTPAVTIPGTSIIYVSVINDGAVKDGATIYAELLEARPVLIDSSYEGAMTTSKSTADGQVQFTCYPGLKYRVTSKDIGLDKTVLAPDAGESANIADLAAV